jgi:hypothetical protein
MNTEVEKKTSRKKNTISNSSPRSPQIIIIINTMHTDTSSRWRGEGVERRGYLVVVVREQVQVVIIDQYFAKRSADIRTGG